MSSFVKCEFCNARISGEKCVFATYRVVFDGIEHYFCCKEHARDFKGEHLKPRSETKEEKK